MIEDTWKNFELSGKVTDYLAYKQGIKEEDALGISIRKTDAVPSFYERGTGSYGTECDSNGNRTECNAHWRV